MKHNMSHTRIYRIWNGMNQRCKNSHCSTYYKYGAKGIRICEEWDSKNENGFLNFYCWSIKHGYTDELTIDRIDSNKDYQPDNCRWATYAEQNAHLNTHYVNESGYRGVRPRKNGRYESYITQNDKTKYIGTFNTKKEALDARNQYIVANNLLHKIQEWRG